MCCPLANGHGPFGVPRIYSCLFETGSAVVAMPSLYLSTLRVGNDPGHGSDMKLAQILATLDAFGLHARGSTTLTGAPGRADRLDKA